MFPSNTIQHHRFHQLRHSIVTGLRHPMFVMMVVFGIVYGCISLVNHANFRTNALDLGAYTNAMYDYVHGRFNDSTVFKVSPENLLADHFDLYLILFSPLLLLFGTSTLLVVQIAALMLGGLGTYRCIKQRSNQRYLAILAALSFYCSFGVFAALSFDYHSNVVAACLVPWLIDAVNRNQWKRTLVFGVLILIAKENMALWLFFIAIGLALLDRKTPKKAFLLLGFSAMCLLYFALVIGVVMPSLSLNSAYPHFHYQCLGNGFGEALTFVVTHPLDTLQYMFVNHNGQIHGDYVKMELHLMLVFSGLPLLFWRPAYIVMLLPIYAQKLFHDQLPMWGIGHQYSIEFVPIFAIGIFDVLSQWSKTRTQRTVAWIVVILQFTCSIRWMDRTIYYTPKSHIRLYAPDHYFRKYSTDEAHRVLQSIPKDAIVSAQSPYVPHLCLRDHIYQFPIIKDAQWVVLNRLEAPFPLDQPAFDGQCDSLLRDEHWEVVHTEPLLVLRKK